MKDYLLVFWPVSSRVGFQATVPQSNKRFHIWALKKIFFSSSVFSSPCFIPKEEMFRFKTEKKRRKETVNRKACGGWESRGPLLSCYGSVNVRRRWKPWWSPDRRVTRSHDITEQPPMLPARHFSLTSLLQTFSSTLAEAFLPIYTLRNSRDLICIVT